MSEQGAPPETPEGAPSAEAPVESSTRDFSLKLESWMSEALTSDLAPAEQKKSVEAPLSLDGRESSPSAPPAEPKALTGEPSPAPLPVEPEKPVVLEPSPFAPTETGRFLTAPRQEKSGGKAVWVALAALVLAALGGAAWYFLLRAR